MRNSYQRMCKVRVGILNKLSYAPFAGHYVIDNNGNSYALFNSANNRRISSYLCWPELWEWIDGYMVALQDVYNTQLQQPVAVDTLKGSNNG